MPDTTAESTLSELMGKTLTGWEEIRQALVLVDRLSEGERNGARVEVYEVSKESSVKVSFHSLHELGKKSKVRSDEDTFMHQAFRKWDGVEVPKNYDKNRLRAFYNRLSERLHV